MAASWYVVKGKQELGPFSARQVKELATAGRLTKADLLRREDQDKPVLAERIAGLFSVDTTVNRLKPPPPVLLIVESASRPSESVSLAAPPPLPASVSPNVPLAQPPELLMPSSATLTGTEPPPLPSSEGIPTPSVRSEPPPLPPWPLESDPQTEPPPLPEGDGSPGKIAIPATVLNLWSRLRNKAEDLAETTKAAARLAALQAKRTKLTQLMLPAAYLALGKDVFDSQRLQAEFADLFNEISATKQQITALNQPRHAPEGKLKAATASVKAAAQATALSVKADGLLRQLGERAFAAHQSQSGPENVVQPILECLERLKKLDAEIEQVSQVGKGGLLTPRRLLIGTGVGLAALILFVLVQGSQDNGPSAGGRGSLKGGGMTAEQLARDFYADKDAAKKKHEGKVITVTGAPSSSGRLAGHADHQINLSPKYSRWRDPVSWNLPLIACLFRGSQATEAEKKAADAKTITVKGRCTGIGTETGLFGSIILDDCEIVATNQELPKGEKGSTVAVGWSKAALLVAEEESEELEKKSGASYILPEADQVKNHPPRSLADLLQAIEFLGAKGNVEVKEFRFPDEAGYQVTPPLKTTTETFIRVFGKPPAPPFRVGIASEMWGVVTTQGTVVIHGAWIDDRIPTVVLVNRVIIANGR